MLNVVHAGKFNASSARVNIILKFLARSQQTKSSLYEQCATTRLEGYGDVVLCGLKCKREGLHRTVLLKSVEDEE